jgi:mannitol/fructose-specific phosphotransferase system IIA component (Ntr-type)
MKLSELLVKDLVLLPLEAADKWTAIAAIAEAPVRAGRAPVALRKGIEQALVQREKSMTTGMEHGIAIPHAAVDGIQEVLAVLAISRAGIPFDALDGQPARILVGLVIPRQKKLLHIKTLAEIAKLLAREGVRRQLLESQTVEQVLAIVKKEDGG